MKEIVITRTGSYDVLKVKEREDPKVEKGQVKIDVKASGLNFAEVMARQGLYPDLPPTPCVVGYEASGVISEIGEGVDPSFHVGQRVVAMVNFGGHADTIVTSQDHILPIDDNMSFVEAASIPVNWVTAYHMLFVIGRVKPGSRVLVNMAAGGVGVAAIQLLKTVENVTIIGTASPGKHEFIRELGCTHPLDYKNYSEEIKKMYINDPNGKKGVDLIIDALGEYKTGYDILNPCGHLIVFGMANMVSGSTRSIFNVIKQYFRIPTFNPLHLMNDNKTVSGVKRGNLNLPSLRCELEEILKLFNQGKVKSIVSKEFTFEQAGMAHKYLEERKNIGKIILVPTESDLTPL